MSSHGRRRRKSTRCKCIKGEIISELRKEQSIIGQGERPPEARRHGWGRLETENKVKSRGRYKLPCRTISKQKDVSSSLNCEQTLWLKRKYTDTLTLVYFLRFVSQNTFILSWKNKTDLLPSICFSAVQCSLLIGRTQIFISKGSESRLCGVISTAYWLVTLPWLWGDYRGLPFCSWYATMYLFPLVIKIHHPAYTWTFFSLCQKKKKKTVRISFSNSLESLMCPLTEAFPPWVLNS